MPPIRKKYVFAEDTSKEDRLQLPKAEWEEGLWPSQCAAANTHNVRTSHLYSSQILNLRSRCLAKHSVTG
jgi:hypothetical protein